MYLPYQPSPSGEVVSLTAAFSVLSWTASAVCPLLLHNVLSSRRLLELSNTINVNKTDTLPPININNDFPLLNGTVACSGETLSVEADVDTDTNAVVSIGVVASGTIIPPSLSDFALVAGLS